MSNDILNQLGEHGLPKLWTSGKRIIYMHYASRYNAEKGKAWPSLDELEKVSGFNKSTILKYRRELCEEGWLFQISKGYSGHRSEFKVLFFCDSKLIEISAKGSSAGDSNSIASPEAVKSFAAQARKSMSESSKGYSSSYPKQINKLNLKLGETREFKEVVQKIALIDSPLQHNGGASQEAEERENETK